MGAQYGHLLTGGATLCVNMNVLLANEQISGILCDATQLKMSICLAWPGWSL